MGEVARVLDRQLGREVALKSLRTNHRDNPDSIARFLREAKATSQLQHPNIPPVHELGQTAEGSPYFTMTLVRGETLSQVVDRMRRGDPETHRQFSFARRIQVIQLVCDAIHYAHSCGFLHRDLKPDNIMIGPFGEVQVMDWGLVRRISGDETPPEPGLTRVGTVVGTLAYAAPEQIAGESAALDARTDVYGLGALLYEFSTLHPPHQGKSVKELMTSVMTRSPARPESFQHEIQGRVPVELSEVILEAMSSLPDERMASALEFRVRLQQILEGKTPSETAQHPLLRGLMTLWAISPVILLAYIAWDHFQ
ncbi:serine/threonine protein kinase [bacterium]|nr:serine/threonine protein kinase [bacterium]